MQSKGVFAETSMLIGLFNETESSGSVPLGGVWERQIRSVRSTLSALMRNHGYTHEDESFRTLLTEVECIINSRPPDPEDLDPLTPNHILTMKSRVVMPPPGNFQKADLYLRKRWKRVQ